VSNVIIARNIFQLSWQSISHLAVVTIRLDHCVRVVPPLLRESLMNSRKGVMCDGMEEGPV